ncbi:BON domain-containing protein [Paraburkholderia sp. B3]|uniref:BON domain-containing protein n=1 Tax=Paraburkholderia sp. B3 TaxID=3134791 RepID=UPI0039820AF3
MKLIQVARLSVAAFALVLAAGAHAQASGTSTDTTTAAAPALPKASKAANRALAKKVHRALSRTNGLDPTHIYVKAVNGAVTLTGSCESQNQMDLAVQAAKGVDGVTLVKNELSIKTPQ